MDGVNNSALRRLPILLKEDIHFNLTTSLYLGASEWAGMNALASGLPA